MQRIYLMGNAIISGEKLNTFLYVGARQRCSLLPFLFDIELNVLAIALKK